jgi:hypothetical protein
VLIFLRQIAVLYLSVKLRLGKSRQLIFHLELVTEKASVNSRGLSSFHRKGLASTRDLLIVRSRLGA